MARRSRINPNDPHLFFGGGRYDDGAPLCRECGMAFTIGQHGETPREVPLFLDEVDDDGSGELVALATGSCSSAVPDA